MLPAAAAAAHVANVPRRHTESDPILDGPPPSPYDDTARALARAAEVPEAVQKELDAANGKAARLERDGARQSAENARLAAALDDSNAAILETIRSAAPENALWAAMLGHSAARGDADPACFTHTLCAAAVRMSSEAHEAAAAPARAAQAVAEAEALSLQAE